MAHVVHGARSFAEFFERLLPDFGWNFIAAYWCGCVECEYKFAAVFFGGLNRIHCKCVEVYCSCGASFGVLLDLAAEDTLAANYGLFGSLRFGVCTMTPAIAQVMR